MSAGWVTNISNDVQEVQNSKTPLKFQGDRKLMIGTMFICSRNETSNNHWWNKSTTFSFCYQSDETKTLKNMILTWEYAEHIFTKINLTWAERSSEFGVSRFGLMFICSDTILTVSPASYFTVAATDSPSQLLPHDASLNCFMWIQTDLSIFSLSPRKQKNSEVEAGRWSWQTATGVFIRQFLINRIFTCFVTMHWAPCLNVK